MLPCKLFSAFIQLHFPLGFWDEQPNIDLCFNGHKFNQKEVKNGIFFREGLCRGSYGAEEVEGGGGREWGTPARFMSEKN